MSRVKMIDISELNEDDYLIDVGNDSVNDLAEPKRERYTDEIAEPMFMYLGRMVKKQHFRAFVWNSDGKRMIANSYAEFKRLIESGDWFETKVEPKVEEFENIFDELAKDSERKKYGRKKKSNSQLGVIDDGANS